MAAFVVLRQSVTIFVTDFTNPNNLTTDLLIVKSLAINSCRQRDTVRELKLEPELQIESLANVRQCWEG